MNIDLSSSLSPLLDQPSSQPEPLEDLQARLRRWRRRRRQVKAGLVAATAVLAVVVVVPLTRDQPNTVDTVDDQQDDHPDTSAPDPFAPGIPMTVVTFEDADGTPWKFDVYETATELCMRKGTSGMGMCGPDSADSDWVMGLAMGDTEGMVNDLFGTVRNEVERIEIRLDTGAVIHRSPQGQEMGFSVGFFAARIPIGTRVTTVIGFDREGNELERIVPQRRTSQETRPTALETTQATGEDEELIRAFLEFAAHPSPQSAAVVPFANEVSLGLSDTLQTVRTRTELAEVGAWLISTSAGFRGYDGPFSALEIASDAGHDTLVSVGPHRHCASPPVPPPGEVAHLRRVSVQPAPESIDTCLRWWTVDLFLTPEGEVAAVTMDIWEP